VCAPIQLVLNTQHTIVMVCHMLDQLKAEFVVKD
jgi:hypothetical protein